MVLALKGMTLNEFARNVETPRKKGVHPLSVSQYLNGKLTSKHIESAVEKLINEGKKELRMVLNGKEENAA